MFIYVNNFRGFNDTFIDLKDVNFLVGENSTGKTSILKIIKLLNTKEFWLVNELSLEGYGFGYFHEITNDLNGNNTFFEIGYYDNENNFGVKLKYVTSDEKPAISEISFLTEQIEIEFKSTGGKRSYRYELTNLKSGLILKDYFKIWVKKIIASSSNFEELNIKGADINRFPLYLQLNYKIFEICQEKELGNTSIQPSIFNYVSFAPIRSNPKRVYGENDFKHEPDGSHTPYLLRERLRESGNSNKTKEKKRIETILNKFGTDSGLFETVSIKNFGTSASTPFELQLLINGRNLNFTNVGYGVSQILPLLAEVIVNPNNSIFAIQQPEVHLHPRGQAAFGDFIFKSYLEEGKKFILETHSDYLIDRYRIRLSKNESEDNPTSQILFFTKDRGGNHIEKIKIHKNGEIQEEQPKAYREFFIREQLDLLNI